MYGRKRNDKGRNEILYVRGPQITKMLFRIYNRWGEIVFESHQPDFGWDGTYSTDGIKAKEGTYIWQIIYKMPDTDERKTLSGHVNLIR